MAAKKVFRERPFLIRSLLAIIMLQFGYVGFQAYSCRNLLLQKNVGIDQIPAFCEDASRNFMEIGKLAVPTIIALLVKSAPTEEETNSKPPTRRTYVRKPAAPKKDPDPVKENG